jgi:hypothetical protein
MKYVDYPLDSGSSDFEQNGEMAEKENIASYINSEMARAVFEAELAALARSEFLGPILCAGSPSQTRIAFCPCKCFFKSRMKRSGARRCSCLAGSETKAGIACRPSNGRVPR